MVLGSAMSAESLRERFAVRLGAFDWKGFSPCQKTVARSHYAPLVQALFWKELLAYVNDALEELGVRRIFPKPAADASPKERAHHAELLAFARAVQEMSVVHAPLDGQPRESWFDPSELAHKATGSPALSLAETYDDLAALCSFVIYCATLGHGWANVRQYDEGGEPEYAVFGLRARVDDAPPASGGGDEQWIAKATPLPCDVANQLIQGFVLSFIEVDNLAQEEKGTGPAALDHLLLDPILGERALAPRMMRLKPAFDRIQEHVAPTGDQHLGVEHIPSRPNA
jgi:hypothetical protein